MRNDKHINLNWAELPIEVLNSIMDRLIMIDDYVKFGAVCVSWRTVFDEDMKKKKLSQSSFPFLLVPPHNHIVVEEEEQEQEQEESYHTSITPTSFYNGQEVFRRTFKKRRLIPQTRSLYNVFSQKVCGDFDVELSHDYYCRGSSFGWLVITKPIIHECGYYYKYDVQLYNPFVSDKYNTINLPSIEDNIIKQLYKDGGYDDLYRRPLSYLCKAVLSCNPLFVRKGNNFVLMAIVTQVRKLAYYTPENKDWTTINWEREDWSYFQDVIYFNKTQQFYAVLLNGAILAIDLIAEAEGAPLIIPKVTQVAPPTHDFESNALIRYLVETSSGELWQVCEQFDFVTGSFSDNYYTTVEFQVYKLDPAGLAWSQIHDMGDTVLFLGDNSSISRTASNFPGCKPNCIYYTDDMSMNQEVMGLYDPKEMGVYNLADGTHQPLYPPASTINFPASIWLEPTLPRSIVFDT